MEPTPVFDAKSFWYSPIDKNVALHPNSKELVAAFLRQKAKCKDIVGINTVGYASPVYIAEADTPTVTVLLDRCFKMTEAQFAELSTQFKAVPIPKHAAPADG